MSSFTKEFVICDEQAINANWSCSGFEAPQRPRAFFCAFCRHPFVIGDEYRMIYTNDIPNSSGNPLTCRKCWEEIGGFDALRARWVELWQEYRDRFKWWAVR